MIIQLDEQPKEIQEQVLELLLELGVETRDDHSIIHDLISIGDSATELGYKSSNSIRRRIKRGELTAYKTYNGKQSFLIRSELY